MRIIIIVAAMLCVTQCGSHKRNDTPDKQMLREMEAKAQRIATIYEYESYEWGIMEQALVYVESKGNDSAVNRWSGARGCLQSMPIMVAECNRLLGHEHYSFDDAFDRDKSLAMFRLIQRHYNKKKSIYKAIKLHNPRAGFWYAQRVYKVMKQLKTKHNGNNKGIG